MAELEVLELLLVDRQELADLVLLAPLLLGLGGVLLQEYGAPAGGKGARSEHVEHRIGVAILLQELHGPHESSLRT